jgi:hypothetical protein
MYSRARGHGSCHIFSVVQLYSAQSARSKSWSCRYQRAQVKKMHPPTWHSKSSANFVLAQRYVQEKGRGRWGLYGSIVQGVSATCIFLACVRAESTTSPRFVSLCLLLDDIPGNLYHNHVLPWETSPLRCESYQLLCCWRARVMRNISAFWINL